MDYSLFKQEIHDIIKIDLNCYKEQQMHRRILQWISRHDLIDYSGLAQALKTDQEHRKKFLDYLTINTSHFFRDPSVFAYIEQEVLPTIKKNSNVRIWSAGCSIGAEIYSIAILAEEQRLSVATYLATDIDQFSIEQAKEAVYRQNQINYVPEHLLRKYFISKNNHYELKKSITEQVTFVKQNLLTDIFEGNFDLILCRNVFIYFTSESQQKLIAKFVNSLKKGGYFVVGSAEHIINPSQFGLARVSYCIYQKQ